MGWDMTEPNTVVVRPNLLQLLAVLLGCTLGVVGGLFLIVGFGTVFAVTAAVVTGLSVLCFVVAAARQRPQVVITPEGFAIQKLFGQESYKWADIDGCFGVITIGWSKAIGFKLSAEYKARVGRKPTSLFSGYDAAVSGVFQLSAEELAELLNKSKPQGPCSGATGVAKAEKPDHPYAPPASGDLS
jgi:hypothetical protein